MLPRPLLVGAALALAAASASAQNSFQPRMGEPVPGLSAGELTLFDAGRTAFLKPLTDAEGRGPILNDSSCAACHSRPTAGGSSTLVVTRFGKMAAGGNPFDPLANLGGSLLQSQAIDPNCQEFVPPEADVTTERATPIAFGAGLVEAIDDADLLALATSPPPGISGRLHMVQPVEGGPRRAGRFGWKAQVATVTTFSADASLNEMGLTNAFFPVENAPNGDLAKLAMCDMVPDPEDVPDAQGFTFVERVTHFQRFLAPPPQTPRSGMSGEPLFDAVGCAGCHVSTPFTTVAVAEPALSGVDIRPYSDFLLHDMGALGDGIVQGDATETEFITRALWGLSQRQTFLHDGRVTNPPFPQAMRAVIAEHDGEGAASRAAFNALTVAEQDQLIAFLGSLGQAEFDEERDHDVDEFDWFFAQPLVTGPGSFFSADDPEAIHDVDQDGDFDLADFQVLQRAFTGQADPQPEAFGSARLDLRAESGGQTSIVVAAGATVAYEVVGTLTDGANEGLASFALDLALPGTTLSQAAQPAVLPMLAFDAPQGFINPAGFGGTPSSGGLLQVGGAQNTIRNNFAPLPKGAVVTGVARPGSPQVLAAGTFTAPATPGTYTLAIANASANAIVEGQDGQPFWRVFAVASGAVTPLSITVSDCTPASYCSAKPSDIGCAPAIVSSGTSTLSGPDDLVLRGTDIVSQGIGFLVWSLGEGSTPFYNGTLCVQTPWTRSPLLAARGPSSPPDCSGMLSFAFDHAYMTSNGLVPGDTVHAQFLYRDRTLLDGTAVGMTDALRFVVCP